MRSQNCKKRLLASCPSVRLSVCLPVRPSVCQRSRNHCEKSQRNNTAQPSRKGVKFGSPIVLMSPEPPSAATVSLLLYRREQWVILSQDTRVRTSQRSSEAPLSEKGCGIWQKDTIMIQEYSGMVLVSLSLRQCESWQWDGWLNQKPVVDCCETSYSVMETITTTNSVT